MAMAKTKNETDNTVLSVSKRLAALKEARTALSDAQEAILARLAKLHNGLACPQDALEAYQLLKALAADAEKALDALKARLVGHHEVGGEFEHGKFAVTFKDTSRTTVPWKDAAIDCGRAIAKLHGVPFIEENFESDMLNRFGKTSTSTTMTVVESA